MAAMQVHLATVLARRALHRTIQAGMPLEQGSRCQAHHLTSALLLARYLAQTKETQLKLRQECSCQWGAGTTAHAHTKVMPMRIRVGDKRTLTIGLLSPHLPLPPHMLHRRLPVQLPTARRQPIWATSNLQIN